MEGKAPSSSNSKGNGSRQRPRKPSPGEPGPSSSKRSRPPVNDRTDGPEAAARSYHRKASCSSGGTDYSPSLPSIETTPTPPGDERQDLEAALDMEDISMGTLAASREPSTVDGGGTGEESQDGLLAADQPGPSRVFGGRTLRAREQVQYVLRKARKEPRKIRRKIMATKSPTVKKAAPTSSQTVSGAIVGEYFADLVQERREALGAERQQHLDVILRDKIGREEVLTRDICVLQVLLDDLRVDFEEEGPKKRCKINWAVEKGRKMRGLKAMDWRSFRKYLALPDVERPLFLKEVRREWGRKRRLVETARPASPLTDKWIPFGQVTEQFGRLRSGVEHSGELWIDDKVEHSRREMLCAGPTATFEKVARHLQSAMEQGRCEFSIYAANKYLHNGPWRTLTDTCLSNKTEEPIDPNHFILWGDKRASSRDACSDMPTLIQWIEGLKEHKRLSELKHTLGAWSKKEVELGQKACKKLKDESIRLKLPFEEIHKELAPFQDLSAEEIRKKMGQLICKDISRGKESSPIAAYSLTEDCSLKGIEELEYVVENTVIVDEAMESKDNGIHKISCFCKGPCGPYCRCIKASTNCGAMALGNQVVAGRKLDGWQAMIVACGPDCGCKGKCTNSAEGLLRQPAPLVLVRKNPVVGFGVYALEDIEPGRLVCEFTGEVISELEHGKREGADAWTFMIADPEENSDTPFLTLMHHVKNHKKFTYPKTRLFIDPSAKGNIGRFVNHSELANVYPIRMVVNDYRPTNIHFLFIASRHIARGSEVFVDYGTYYMGFDKCLCDNVVCSKEKEERLKLYRQQELEMMLHYHELEMGGRVQSAVPQLLLKMSPTDLRTTDWRLSNLMNPEKKKKTKTKKAKGKLRRRRKARQPVVKEEQKQEDSGDDIILDKVIQSKTIRLERESDTEPESEADDELDPESDAESEPEVITLE